MSKVRLWVGGRKLPQITKHFDDGNIAFDASFTGWRRLSFSKYIPFANWDRPKINLTVRIIKPLIQGAAIERMEIKCDSPNADFENFGWSTNDIHFDKPYNIVLPALDRTGEYKYSFSTTVYLRRGQGYESWPFPNRPAKLMSTGQIFSREIAAVTFIAIIITAILTFTLTEFGQSLLNLLSKSTSGGTK